MPEKRGRPRSDPHLDPAVQQRREQGRIRQETRRHRQRDALAATLLSTEQDEQQNLILQRPFIEDAPPTPAQLGLRVQGLTLAQDPINAQLQQQSIEVDDHHALYNTNSPPSINPVNPLSAGVPGPSTLQASRPPLLPSQRPVADFPTSHPAYPTSSPVRKDTSSVRKDISSIFRAFSAIPPNPRRPSFSPITDASPTPSLPPISSNIASGRIEIDRADPLRHSNDPVDPFGFSDDEELEVNNNDELLEVNEIIEQFNIVAAPPIENHVEERPHIIEAPAAVEDDDEEDDEFHDFPSEHSSGHSTPEAEPSALEFTVEKLVDTILDGLHGCAAEDHTQRLQAHVARDPDNHHGLDALFADPTFPSVLSFSDYITQERLDRQPAPTYRQR